MNIPSSGPAVLTLRGSTGDIHTNWLGLKPYRLASAPPRIKRQIALARTLNGRAEETAEPPPSVSVCQTVRVRLEYNEHLGALTAA